MSNRAGKMEPKKVIGVAIDCADENALAEFYERMLGWTRTFSGNGMAVVSAPGAPMLLVFQAVQGYRPPVWPWEADKQAQMMHFDFYVDDLDAAVEQAVACGATLSEVQFFESSRTLFDPAGHPFCLSTTWEEQLYAK